MMLFLLRPLALGAALLAVLLSLVGHVLGLPPRGRVGRLCDALLEFANRVVAMSEAKR